MRPSRVDGIASIWHLSPSYRCLGDHGDQGSSARPPNPWCGYLGPDSVLDIGPTTEGRGQGFSGQVNRRCHRPVLQVSAWSSRNQSAPKCGLLNRAARQSASPRRLTAAPSHASNYWMVSGRRSRRPLPKLSSLRRNLPRRHSGGYSGDFPHRSTLGNAQHGCF